MQRFNGRLVPLLPQFFFLPLPRPSALPVSAVQFVHRCALLNRLSICSCFALSIPKLLHWNATNQTKNKKSSKTQLHLCSSRAHTHLPRNVCKRCIFSPRWFIPLYSIYFCRCLHWKTLLSYLCSWRSCFHLKKVSCCCFDLIIRSILASNSWR